MKNIIQSPIRLLFLSSKTAIALCLVSFTVPLVFSQHSPVPVQAAPPAEMRLGLRLSGDRSSTDANGKPRDVRVFILTVGNPRAEDRRAMARANGGFGVFAMDSAQYFHNDDLSWRLFDFHMPGYDNDAESQRFINFMGTPEARRVMEHPYALENSGKPGDFIHKNMRMARQELPPPLNRVSDETLKAVIGIFRYHADGTIKIYLREPLDEEDNAKQVYQQFLKETGAQPGGIDLSEDSDY